MPGLPRLKFLAIDIVFEFTDSACPKSLYFKGVSITDSCNRLNCLRRVTANFFKTLFFGRETLSNAFAEVMAKRVLRFQFSFYLN